MNAIAADPDAIRLEDIRTAAARERCTPSSPKPGSSRPPARPGTPPALDTPDRFDVPEGLISGPGEPCCSPSPAHVLRL